MFEQKTSDSPRFYFPKSTVVLTIALFFAVGCATEVSAQKSSSKPDISKLQQQLETLQIQIASLEKQKSNNVEKDSRVRSVGSQRMRRNEVVIEAPLQIRLYDLSDLFAVSPSYPAVMPDEFSNARAVFAARSRRMTSGVGQGGFGGGGQGGGGIGGGGGVFRVSPISPMKAIEPVAAPRQEAASLNMRSAQVSMKQMVNTIKNTVEPELWGDSQGEAKVQFLGNTLLITATDSMHTRITNLLNLFREHWGKRRTISIQTYWIRAGAGDTADLLDEKSTEIGAGVVSQDKWKQFLADARSDKRFAYSATLTGHNNQTLHALSGQQKQLIVGAEPFLRTDAAMWFENVEDVNPFGDDDDSSDEDMDYFNRTKKIVGFHPIQQSFHNGAAIQVTPLATRGGNFVILDLHAKINELVDQEKGKEKPTVFVLGEKEKSEVKLDHTDYVSCRMNTTLRCPKEQIVLAGSMTFDPGSDAEHPNIYLFVKTSVHTISEDKSDWAPDVKQNAAAKTKRPVDKASDKKPTTGEKK